MTVKNLTSAIAVCFFLISLTIAQEPSGESSATIIWQDEFNGTNLDTTKWINRHLGPRRDAVNVKDAVSLNGKGHLIIETSKRGDEYHTGMIGTQEKFEHTFGYWECRLQFQKQVGHWSAFWLQSPTISKTGNPQKYGTEIDIIEYMVARSDTVIQNLHWDGYGEEHKTTGHHTYFPGLDEGFHTVALEWTPDEYIFYVDDRETWRTTKAVSHRPEYAILSLEVGPWAGDIANGNLPDSLIVDYVRVYDKKPK